MSELAGEQITAEMKARLVADGKAHQAADRYVQGAYVDASGPEWKGCAVGCTTAPLLAANLGVDIGELPTPSWHDEQEPPDRNPRLAALLGETDE